MSNAVGNIPVCLTLYFDIIMSLVRIDKFLKSEELDLGYIEEGNKLEEDSKRPCLKFDNVDFYWRKPYVPPKPAVKPDPKASKKNNKKNDKKKTQTNANGSKDLSEALLDKDTKEESITKMPTETDFEKEMTSFRIKDMNLTINQGQLIFIIGKIGSGKSSLLYSILGEMSESIKAQQPTTNTQLLPSETNTNFITSHFGGDTTNQNPSLKINGSIAYLGQKPWLTTGTIKENIIMNKPYNAEKFSNAILWSGLAEDIKGFKEKINKHVGEGGESLSGGQRARVALAMCIYQDSDIYLLDDP